MDKGSGAVRRVPFWRSLQTKFALTYIVIVAAVLILLNTYPLVVSEKLAYQSKQASMLNQASVLASALATGPEALTAEGATRTVELLRGSLGVTRVVVTDPNGLVLCDFQDGVGRTDTAGRYALFWELVTALRGNNVFRSEYGGGAFRSWAAVPITYRSMTQGAVYLYEYDAEQGALLQGITLARLFHGFNCRGSESIFRLKLSTNKYSVLAFLAGVVLLLLVLFTPGLKSLFMVAPAFGFANLGEIVLLAFLPTLVIQLVKLVCDARRGK